jgi:hypothetical protein
MFSSFTRKEVPYALPRNTNCDCQGEEDEEFLSSIMVEV